MNNIGNYISEKLYINKSYEGCPLKKGDKVKNDADIYTIIDIIPTIVRDEVFIKFINKSKNRYRWTTYLNKTRRKLTPEGRKRLLQYDYVMALKNVKTGVIEVFFYDPEYFELIKPIEEKLYIGKNFKIDDKIFRNIMDICKRGHKNLKSEELDKIVKDWIEKNDVEEFFIMVNEPQWFDLEKKYSKQELEHIVRSGAFADTAYKTTCKEENKDTVIKGICTIYSNGNTIIIDYGGDDFYVIKKQHVQQ